MCCQVYVPDPNDREYQKILAGVKLSDGLITGNIARPGNRIAVIANNKSLTPTAYGMLWGYHAYQKLIFNTRSETAAQKPLFADGFMNRRCVIPVNSYFEWNEQKIKYRIRPTEGGLMYLAGIYRLEENSPVFSVLTREPTPELRQIHNRMPVILPREAVRPWLNPTQNPTHFLTAASSVLSEQCRL